MGLGFTLIGQPGKTGLLKRQDAREACKELAEKMVELFPENGRMVEGRTFFAVFLAECSIYIWPQKNRVIANSKTSAFGGGFHIAAIDLLKQAAQACRIEWTGQSNDDTGYFSGAPASAVLEAMTGNIRTICSHGAANFSDSSAICMDLQQQFTRPTTCKTVMGPRSLAWVDAVGGGVSSGTDIYPWPEPGFGPSFRQGRALYAMWCQAPWVSVDRVECQDIYDQVSDDLASMVGISDNEIPWHEWNELVGLGAAVSDELKVRIEKEAAARPQPEERIGYRRESVRYLIDTNFAMTIPGWMLGDNVDGWSLYDREMFVGFSPLHIPPGQLEAVAGPLLQGERLEIDTPFPSIFSRAWFDSPYDGTTLLIQGLVQVGSEGATITMTSETADVEPRMREILATLEHQSPYEAKAVAASDS